MTARNENLGPRVAAMVAASLLLLFVLTGSFSLPGPGGAETPPGPISPLRDPALPVVVSGDLDRSPVAAPGGSLADPDETSAAAEPGSERAHQRALEALAAGDRDAFERQVMTILRAGGEPLARKVAALRAVASRGRPEAVRSAFELAWLDPAPALRDYAVRLLARRAAGDEGARALLLACARRSDLDATLRSRAIHGALRAMPGPQVTAQGPLLLAEMDAGVIGMAAAALRANPAREADRLLRDLAVVHPSAPAREQIEGALTRSPRGESDEPVGR